jgi:hypothetical protein
VSCSKTVSIQRDGRMRAGPPGGAVGTSSVFSLWLIGITALTERPRILSDGDQ